MEITLFVIGLAIGLIIGIIGGIFVLLRRQEATGRSKIAEADEQAKRILEEADKEGRDVVEDAEQKAKAKLNEAEETISRRRRELDKEDSRLQRRREDLDHRLERLEQRESNLNKRQSRMDKKENELKQQEELHLEELQRISQMTIEEARGVLLEATEKEARNDMARIIRQVEAEARDEADKRARDIISLAVQRLASEHVSEI